MRINVELSIGYPTAICRDTLEIPDDEIEGMNAGEINQMCDEYTTDWANNYIETWWEVV